MLNLVPSFMVSEERAGSRKDRLSRAFDSMTEATGKVLGERTKSMLDAGSRLQHDMVDLTFDVCRPENWSPEKVLDRAADLAESSAEALRETRSSRDSDAPSDCKVTAKNNDGAAE